MNHKKLAPLSIALAALDPHLERFLEREREREDAPGHRKRERERERGGKNIEEVFATIGILLLEFSLATTNTFSIKL